MKITLTTPYVSTNRLYTVNRNGSRRKTAAGAAAAKALAWEAKAQMRGEPLKNDLAVQIFLFFPDNRKRDLDNIKGLLDAMTGVLWLDDSQIVDLHIRKYVCKENPRVEIVI